jgi:hypothetical protein
MVVQLMDLQAKIIGHSAGMDAGILFEIKMMLI